MGLMAEAGLKSIGYTPSPLSYEMNPAAMAFSPIANMFFNSGEHALGQGASTDPLKMLGCFVFRKYITRTQMAQPFRYSPLVHHGQALLGGLPSKKTGGGFWQAPGEWISDTIRALPTAMEDWYDNMNPSDLAPWNWLKDTQGKINW